MITYNYERVMLSRSDKKAEVRDTYRTRIQFANGWAVSFVAAADDRENIRRARAINERRR